MCRNLAVDTFCFHQLSDLLGAKEFMLLAYFDYGLFNF